MDNSECYIRWREQREKCSRHGGGSGSVRTLSCRQSCARNSSLVPTSPTPRRRTSSCSGIKIHRDTTTHDHKSRAWDDTALGQCPGSDLLISDLCYSLTMKLTRASDSRYAHNFRKPTQLTALDLSSPCIWFVCDVRREGRLSDP